MKKLIWLNNAQNDLGNIGDFIAQDNPFAAREIVTTIKAKADILAHTPRIGWPGRIKNTFELVVTGLPYIVVYTIKDSEVRIISVIHAVRRWPDSFNIH